MVTTKCQDLFYRPKRINAKKVGSKEKNLTESGRVFLNPIDDKF